MRCRVTNVIKSNFMFLEKCYSIVETQLRENASTCGIQIKLTKLKL